MIRRLLPRRLSTQLVLTAVIVLVVAQAVAFPLFFYARMYQGANTIQGWMIDRFAAISQVLSTTPPQTQELILDSARSHPLSLEILEDANAIPMIDGMRESPALAARVQQESRGAVVEATVYTQGLPAPNRPVIVIVGTLQDGRTLRAMMQIPDPSLAVAMVSLGSATVLSALLAVVLILILRRLTRPLSNLAKAAEALGRGEDSPPLDDNAPLEVQESLRAFNRMQVRIREHIEQRTRMLAAVSHDLRTPITALRLQAEYVEDPAQRERMLNTLGEMEAVTESALSYLKNPRSVEEAQAVDLAALVDSVCEELRLIGLDVDFEYQQRLIVSCRPGLMKRALRNLIENAAQYGQQAQVEVRQHPDYAEVRIQDQGPGIAPELVAEALKPFNRLEGSRNRRTGGSGLGLSIAQEIIEKAHGELQLSNRPEGGLLQLVKLPV